MQSPIINAEIPKKIIDPNIMFFSVPELAPKLAKIANLVIFIIIPASPCPVLNAIINSKGRKLVIAYRLLKTIAFANPCARIMIDVIMKLNTPFKKITAKGSPNILSIEIMKEKRICDLNEYFFGV